MGRGVERAAQWAGQFKRLPDFIIVLFFSFVGKSVKIKIYPKISHLFRDSTSFIQIVNLYPNISHQC